MRLENVTSSPVTVKEIDAASYGGDEGVLRVVGVDVIPPLGAGTKVSMARYLTDPPLLVGRRVCRIVKTETSSGYVVTPKGTDTDEALVATRVRATGVGKAIARGLVVVYEHEDETYAQILPITIAASVASDGRPLRFEKDERECAEKLNVDRLPKS